MRPWFWSRKRTNEVTIICDGFLLQYRCHHSCCCRFWKHLQSINKSIVYFLSMYYSQPETTHNRYRSSKSSILLSCICVWAVALHSWVWKNEIWCLLPCSEVLWRAIERWTLPLETSKYPQMALDSSWSKWDAIEKKKQCISDGENPHAVPEIDNFS